MGQWLRSQGLDPAELEQEIHRVYGHQPGPLPMDAFPPEQGDSLWSAAAPHPVARRSGGEQPSRPEEVDTSPRNVRTAAPMGVLRALDAAANRTREGLRVVEDYVRFVLDDRHLTERLKSLRHDLAAALAGLPMARRLAARETQADVGTGLSTPGEECRPGAAGVWTANFLRVQEGLRTLEELGKLADPTMAAAAKQLRYRAYTLQRAVHVTSDAIERLAGARLYVLLDGRDSPDAFARMAESLVMAGVHVLQLRDKRLSDRELLGRARRLREVTAGTAVLCVVNDRADIAALAGADGVHVGQDELGVKDARAIVGPEALVGVSTHSIEQARQAVLDGADYLGVGPVFASGTKRFSELAGLDLVRAVAAEIRLPAFAIGGITPDNLPQVLAAGLGRAAVSGAVVNADAPEAAARRLLGALHAD